MRVSQQDTPGAYLIAALGSRPDGKYLRSNVACGIAPGSDPARSRYGLACGLDETLQRPGRGWTRPLSRSTTT
jgi:hypothetical protein